MVEGEGRRLVLKISDELFDWLTTHCSERAYNRSALLRKLIEDYRRMVEGKG